MAPQESQICGGNLPKRKRLAAGLCQILCMVTIEIVINCTPGAVTLYPGVMMC